MRNTLNGPAHRSAMLSAFLLLAVGSGGCAAGNPSPAGRALRPSPGPTLLFDNAGIEPVKLYLSERGSEWYVGYVLPGRTAALPLPAPIAASPAGRSFNLVVVPSTAARFPRGPGGAGAGVITSDSFNSEYLTAMRWRVVGRWIVPVPGAARP